MTNRAGRRLFSAEEPGSSPASRSDTVYNRGGENTTNDRTRASGARVMQFYAMRKHKKGISLKASENHTPPKQLSHIVIACNPLHLGLCSSE